MKKLIMSLSACLLLTGCGASVSYSAEEPVEDETNKSDTEIVKAAEEKGVLVFPLSRYLRGTKPTGTYLSLGFAALDDEKMEKAIAILLKCC